ncbi:acetyl-CoA carboxylase carboxyltransferase subunit beta [Hwanghaeella grinnelliae]|uniref:Acetyl-coenzyme A carboxylase carboxyl transferase subunit beta n=1 Tax=Hwanghaeella grinnelliae TaxID=2500179 RepID=A0A437QNB3_9PROT|nr:acetyl-CoA carboxylase, carboxyltransferase subunit beta [Hwanghaeella grinnelliae]RVU36018.1 acetyl-CoA carboxylase carboxyltransferase subunit beta [Hwanghaeella grinnelliae]
MSWLERYVRPKIKALVGAKPEVPDNLWHKCDNCGQMIFHRDLVANHHVCQHCNHHMRLPAEQRLEMLFDDGEYDRAELPKTPLDPLKFRDRKRYSDRLKEAQSKQDTKTANKDAIIVAHGKMEGRAVVVAAFDFSFMGGSMGVAVGEGIVTAAHLAVFQQAPLIIIPATGGARMQEGILSLMQMPRTVIAVQEVKEAGLPFFVLLTDPTTGGVSASFAMLGDIHIAEPGAVIGFAGRRVIEQTVKETLPDGFQTAEYLLEHGMVDIVAPRTQIRPTIIRLISLLMDGKPVDMAEASSDKDAAEGDLDIPDSAESGPDKT